MIYWKTFWMEEVFDFSVRGKQNMGARNFVRQALLDKRLFYSKGSLSILEHGPSRWGRARSARPSEFFKFCVDSYYVFSSRQDTRQCKITLRGFL